MLLGFPNIKQLANNFKIAFLFNQFRRSKALIKIQPLTLYLTPIALLKLIDANRILVSIRLENGTFFTSKEVTKFLDNYNYQAENGSLNKKQQL